MMIKAALSMGGLLIALGVAGWAGSGAPTSLIPAYFGVALIACGLWALRPAWRKHAMHVAALVGQLGAVVPGWMVVRTLTNWAQGITPPRPWATASQAVMAVVCAWFLVLCVRSFIRARLAPKK